MQPGDPFPPPAPPITVVPAPAVDADSPALVEPSPLEDLTFDSLTPQDGLLLPEGEGEFPVAALDEVRGLIARARVLSGWIEKARALGPEFRSDTVQRVVADYLHQFREVVGESVPVLAEVRRLRRALDEEADGIRQSVERAEVGVDELRLRHLIGELSRERYEQRRSDLETEIDSYRAELAKVLARGEHLDGLVQAAGQVQGELEQVLQEATRPADSGSGPEFLGPPSPLQGAGESGEGGEDPTRPERPASSPHSNDDPLMAFVGGEEPGESPEGDAAEEDSEHTPPPVHNSGEWAQAPFAGESVPLSGSRPMARLVQLVLDGKNVEYRFRDDVLSVGRGRNNDVQLRHDAKVSRYHCRVVYRDGEFFVEDHRSRNGTAVDGVTVSRRRLQGGEKLTVGDTEFLFEVGGVSGIR